MDARARALELVEQWRRELQQLLPAEADVFDAHLHLGHDIDGMVGDYAQLEQIMGEYRISRAFMFCLDEPDRHPAFTAANDRTLAFAARSDGRLIPFVRLDLNESPLEEARRCLDAGARGIKLHPRAQKFTATDERLAPVFELAAERRVPILIHAGRGLPPIADGLARLVERYPEASLILAHAGIADMAALAQEMAGRKGVFFNTSAERNGHAETVDGIRELLEAARDLWATVPAIEEEVEAMQTLRLTHRLVHIAQIESVAGWS